MIFIIETIFTIFTITLSVGTFLFVCIGIIEIKNFIKKQIIMFRNRNKFLITICFDNKKIQLFFVLGELKDFLNYFFKNENELMILNGCIIYKNKINYIKVFDVKTNRYININDMIYGQINDL